MKKFAVINDNLVINTIIADSKEIAEQCNPGLICVEYTDENPAGIGWLYDGTTLTAPVIETPAEEIPEE